MNTAISKLFELRPDPYDNSQRKYLRLCLFLNVENASDLADLVKVMDIALIRAELVLEPFILLVAANRALFQAAHNQLSTLIFSHFFGSLSAELIYCLSPNRNIRESLATFGIAGTTRALLVAIFDDAKGKKMREAAKHIKGTPVTLEKLRENADEALIRQIYQLDIHPQLNSDNLSDLIVSRIVSKDLLS
ncbi:hypothetical protein niasHT_024461 [Heterodera trifolii]|uniref:EKC/KEOPS complex subunit CGI121 n=1 Tax=Heterodera trifolii TaxID=157864 RepID=A0ABD2JYP0_9BILA